MYISNVEELVEALKPKLRDYLENKIGREVNNKNFKCFIHKDDTPSMAFNPKSNNTVVHCFGCGTTQDIFGAAAHFEDLPSTGSEWITQTLPCLAERFGLLIKLGEQSLADKERTKLYKLMSDIANILAGTKTKVLEDYLLKRSWSDEKLIIGNISQQDLITKLSATGWEATTLYSTLLINAKNPIFADDRITFVIKDYRGRPIGFVARNLSNEGAKYVNSPESLIYEKSKVLLGLDSAISESKKTGIFIVEGPGDLAALHRVGIFNAVATCGTAFTSEHLHLLKMLGIKQAFFALDWDDAGQKAMRRILKEELKFATGVSCFVIEAPKSGEKDVSELLEGTKDYQAFTQLRKVPAFEWVLQIAVHSTPEDLCAEMIPIIASEGTSVRREILIKILSDKTGISFTSIKEDIAAIRDSKVRERNERLEAAAQKYHKDIQSDPSNAQVLLSQHQNDLLAIEKEFNRQPQGVDYQLSRYDALQHNKLNSEIETSEFTLGRYTLLGHALSGGMSWTESCFAIVGGRANCFAKDTLFSQPGSKKVKAYNLKHVASMDTDRSIMQVERVTDYINSGRQECFRVTNALGFSVETTMAHRYWTKTGWKQLKEISIGDKVGAPIQSGYFGTDTLGADKAELIGLMIGDGNMTQPRPLFTNTDPAMLSRIEELTKKIFGENIQTVNYESREEREHIKMVGFTQKDWKTNRDSGGRCIPNPVTTLFKDFNLYGKRAWEKTIPEEIMNGSREEVIACLRGLWSTDGSIYTAGTRVRMEYGCTSKILVEQIQELLYKFGIVTRVSSHNKNNPIWHDQWRLTLDQKDMIKSYIDQIGFIGEKQERCAEALKTIRVPMKRDRINDIVWTRIVSIESVGIKDTCDITVAATHSFCLPGFVLHNSGKTATTLAIGTDIALHDENAIVIGHFTDDSYIQIEPRIKCNIASMLREQDMPHLTIGGAASPRKNLNTSAEWEVYYNADKQFRHLIEEERLFVLDQEDGKNLATLERTLRQIRNRYPEKKVFIMSDGLHNYQDFLGNDQTSRMTRISSAMKDFAGQYKCSIWATAQYRKNMPFNRAELKLPVDDDLADARALMYDPNLIVHVYNDLHDRAEDCEIFWEKKELPGIRLPRLLLCVTKNKLTEFKDKLVLNMDPKTVSLTQVDALRARLDSEHYVKSMNNTETEDASRIMVEADYD